MPHLDGVGLIQALRSDPATRDLPVLMLSALAGESDSVEGLGMGANDYIVKPFSSRELLARVQSHLDLHRVRLDRDQYQNLLQDFPTMVWHANATATCDYFNKAWLNFTGRTLADSTGQGWINDIHPDDREECVRRYLSAFAQHETFEMEYRLIHHTGEARWIIDIGCPCYGPLGQFEGYIGMCLDNTERRQNLEALAFAQGLAQLGSWQVDAASGMITASPELLSMLKVPSGGHLILGDYRAAGAFFRDGEDFYRFRQIVDAALVGEVTVDHEMHLVDLDGEVHVVRVRGAVVRDDSGNPLHLRGTIQDITEQRQAEEALRAAAQAEQEGAWQSQVAAALQASLSPLRVYHSDDLSMAGFYRAGVAGTEVGGDWYDVIELDSGRSAVVVGDVMGRGISAATVMGQLRSTVRAYARLDLSPAQTIKLLDRVVRDIGE
ncbi:MAG: PAS domain-containing protein, partial [Acidimicrobiales bacterium]